MTKIKLVDGTIINAIAVELVHGILQISTVENTVEELAEMFSNKDNTSLLVLMTESGVECGFQTGFTSFAGIKYDAEGTKTVELFQPVDPLEARVSDAEGAINQFNNDIDQVNEDIDQVGADVDTVEATVNALLGV